MLCVNTVMLFMKCLKISAYKEKLKTTTVIQPNLVHFQLLFLNNLKQRNGDTCFKSSF